MASSLGLLLLAVVLAGFGGELFVRGTVGLSRAARIPAVLAGTTVAAFATSTPELSVGLQAAINGQPEIALGDALGSNVINVGVVLGSAVVVSPLALHLRGVRRELGVAAVAPLVTLLALVDGTVARAEAAVLLLMFSFWLAAVAREALGHRAAAAHPENQVGQRLRPAAHALVGVVLLIAAGRMMVLAAQGVGSALGLDPFVVGASLVALGTSTPELATTFVARWRGHEAVGVGAVLGSNVFNNLWIVGVVAVVRPMSINASEVLLAVVAGVAGVALLLPRATGVVPRWRGAALLTLAATYMAATVMLGG